MYRLLSLLFILLFGCSQQKENNSLVELRASDEYVRLPLDETTKTDISTFFVYHTDTASCFIFQNEETNDILFYDRATQQQIKKVHYQVEGANGVGRFVGFYPLSLNEFILTRPDLCELYFVNDQGIVKKKIRYDQNENGDRLIPYVSATGDVGPIALIGNKLFLRQMINPYFGEDILEKSPVSIMIDTVTHEVTTLPLRFPSVVPAEKYLNHQNGLNTYRCFNGREFVYSFSLDEEIYVASGFHDTIQSIRAKSKYIDKLQTIEPEITDFKQALKRMAEQAVYRNILYDPYREVYYRFVYLENELNDNENFRDLIRYGHRLFSVLIIDKNFKVIGETLFPEFIYNPTLAFVDEDGFYISNSHYKNPDYNEDVLSFRKFTLTPITDK